MKFLWVTFFGIVCCLLTKTSSGEKLDGCLGMFEECEIICKVFIRRTYGTIKTWGQSYITEISDQDVKVISVWNIDKIFRKIFIQFPNVESLEIRNQSIGEIKLKTFENARKLRYLVLDFNGIEKLSSAIFDGAWNLEQLSFSYNRIQTIDEDTFQNLPKISILYLNNNRINKLHDNTFKPLANLKRIFVNDNLIEYLPKNLFKYNHELIVIDLSANRLKWIHNQMFSFLRNLDTLKLSSNACIDRDFHTVNSYFAAVEKMLITCSIS